MKDLNNIYFFAKIVEHGSLSAAADALGVSKSVLSQHLAKLEADLGVRLIQRTTRKLQITDVGLRYYERCRAVLAEVEQAGNLIDATREVPRGRVRLSCPLNFAQVLLAPMLAKFMAQFPEVEIVLDFSNRELDLIAEGYDLALRIVPSVKSSSLIVRSFPLQRHVLLASPGFIERHGLPRRPEDLKGLPSVGDAVPGERGSRHVWDLTDATGATRTISHRPRLLSEDLFMLKEAVLAGCGIADFPSALCYEELSDGRLLRLLPTWQLPDMRLYAMYPSRSGLPLAVRSLINFIAEHLQPVIDSIRTEGFGLRVVHTENRAAKFAT